MTFPYQRALNRCEDRRMNVRSLFVIIACGLLPFAIGAHEPSASIDEDGENGEKDESD